MSNNVVEIRGRRPARFYRQPMGITQDWADAIDDYLSAQAAAGRPVTTRNTRRQQLEHLARRIGAEPWEVTGEQLVAYSAAQNWAVETRRGRRTTFRSFYQWAKSAGHRHQNPHRSLDRVRAVRGTPRPVPRSIYDEAVAVSDARTRLILQLAFEAGLRRREIAVVHSRDLFEDLNGWSLLVHGKGGKKRYVPLTARLAMALRRLPSGYAFPGREDGHLSARWVGKLATGVLPEHWTIHTLRHSFASRVYSVEHDLFVVQEVLGHSNPNTTRVYVRIDDTAIRRAVMAATA